MFEVIIGIILVIVGWLQFAYGKLMRFKKEARTSWVRIEVMIRARAEALMELLELLDEKAVQETEMAEIFEMDGGYRPSQDREDISALAEAVTPHAYSLFKKCREAGILEEEIREIEEMDEELEKMAEGYNKSIHSHNDIIGWKKYRLQIMVLKPQVLKDFVLRRKVL